MIEDELWHGKPIPRDQKPGIVFEDEELIVINKPPFMITHPAGKNLFYCATVFFETIYKKTIHSIFHSPPNKEWIERKEKFLQE